MKRLAATAALCALLAGCTTAPEHTGLPSAPPQGEPPGLAGLDAASVKTMFGTPTFVRKDGSSQIWRYDGTRCRAFFFLYAQNGSATVRHVETLPRGSTMAADPSCLDALRVQPAKVSSLGSSSRL